MTKKFGLNSFVYKDGKNVWLNACNRQGMGKGQGKGYKNLMAMDSYVHSMSAHGIKVLPIKRVSYGKLNPKLAKDKREYMLLGGSPVGTIKEWKKFAKGSGYDSLDVQDVDEKFEVTLDAKMFSMYGQKWKVLEKGKDSVMLRNKKGETLTITRDEYEQFKPKTIPTGDVIREVVGFDAKGTFKVGDYVKTEGMIVPYEGKVVKFDGIYAVVKQGNFEYRLPRSSLVKTKESNIRDKYYKEKKLDAKDKKHITFERKEQKIELIKTDKEHPVFGGKIVESRPTGKVKWVKGKIPYSDEMYEFAKNEEKRGNARKVKLSAKTIRQLESGNITRLEVQQAITVPSTEFNKPISPAKFKKRVDEVQKYLANTFGGETTISGEGGYVAKSGELIPEKVKVVTSFADDKDFEQNVGRVVKKIKDWKKEWTQESVGYQVEDDLYLI